MVLGTDVTVPHGAPKDLSIEAMHSKYFANEGFAKPGFRADR